MASLWFGMASLCCSDGHQVVLDGWPLGSASIRQGVIMVPFLISLELFMFPEGFP